ncbi:MAG: hypothetical protein ACERKX_15270 [Anaerolineales bacterium]
MSEEMNFEEVMTTEETMSKGDATRKRQGDALSGGIFLISLGVLIFTGWWWPGIMVALGLSGGAGLIFRGRTREGISTLVFFIGIAVAVELIRRTDISGVVIGSFILIGVGIIILAKAFLFRDS